MKREEIDIEIRERLREIGIEDSKFCFSPRDDVVRASAALQRLQRAIRIAKEDKKPFVVSSVDADIKIIRFSCEGGYLPPTLGEYGRIYKASGKSYHIYVDDFWNFENVVNVFKRYEEYFEALPK